MLFTFRSIALFSSVIAASLLVFGVAAVPVPSDPAEPVVTPAPVLAPPPDDCAVPALLVPGAGLDAFPRRWGPRRHCSTRLGWQDRRGCR